MKTLNPKTIVRLKAVLFCLALMPLANLITGAFLDRLGANPIEKITRSTGYWTLTLLMVTLAATPLRLLFGWSWTLRLRRMSGLFAFFYGSLHFLTYLILDQFFDWPAIIADIAKRPYITIGFPSFVLMVPLALTSTDRMIRRLGGRRWLLLHRLIYPIAIGGVVHFGWLVKKDITSPLMFGTVLALLFGIRILNTVNRRIKPSIRRTSSKMVN
ncbi:MAG: sulfite oxidase heme-binding subunit YedZ [Gammaproteobacteria bacterium]